MAANIYTYGVLPFDTTTFTSPDADTSDSISALNIANFTIDGNGGADTVNTGSGDDSVTTGSGDDIIAARGGNNTVEAGDGANQVTTRDGNDTVTTGTGADTVDTAGGDDTIVTGNGNDVINAGGGNNTVNAGAGADRISTGSGMDMIDAGADRDVIQAGAGNDTIDGGTGNDRISSQAGIDSLTGGGGHDTFVYGGLASAMLGADTISDFSAADPTLHAGDGDRLNLKGLVGAFTGTAGLTLDELVASGHLTISGTPTETVISFDSNGSAALGSQGVLVTLEGVAFISESDAVLALTDNLLTF